MKKFAALIVAMIASLAFVGTANADNETVSLSADVTPQGPMYQAAPKPVDLAVSAKVDVPAGTAEVTPTKNIKINFPTNITMHPDNKKTPVCTDAKLGDTTNISDPKVVLAACPNSVVGTGHAVLYAARNPVAVLDSPILIAFNAGVDSKTGNPKIKIWGYAWQTNYGILMNTELQKNGVMDIPVPPLSFDSAVKDFQLAFPGSTLTTAEFGLDPATNNYAVKGLDPNFVQATCPADGKLTSHAEFILQRVAIETGQPIGDAHTATTAPYTSDCTGLVGKAKLGKAKAKGPKAVKNGKKGVFKVTFTNTGTGVAKGVKITAPGGKASAGNVNPGATKTVKVKAKVKGKKGKKVSIKFTIKAKGASTKAVAKVKVK